MRDRTLQQNSLNKNYERENTNTIDKNTISGFSSDWEVANSVKDKRFSKYGKESNPYGYISDT